MAVTANKLQQKHGSYVPRHVSVGDFRMTERAWELLHEALDGGQVVHGKLTRRFETKFAELHDCKYGIAVNSGTSALYIAVQALRDEYGWKPGEEIIVPATTFVASSNVVIHNGLQPVFVDVSPDTFNLDETKIEAALTPNTVAVMPVHLFGQPCNMSAIKQIADLYGLKVIEDSCECMFAEHQGRHAGSWGDIGCFSTYVAHILVTGVGGLATTNNASLAARMRSLANHGLELSQLNPDDNFYPNPAIGRRFKFSHVGHSFRITEMEAALGLAQLEDFSFWYTRQRNAEHLRAGIELINKYYNAPLLLQQNNLDQTTHSHMMFPLVCKDTAHKEPLMRWLNERQIETRDALPLINQPIYSWVDMDSYPVSKQLVEGGFYVGCHQYLDSGDVQYTVDTIRAYFDKDGHDGHN